MKLIICPRCKLKNITEENYCENCLMNLKLVVPQDYFARWRSELL